MSSPSTNGQQQPTPLDIANNLIEFLDQTNQHGTTNPDAMLPVTLLMAGGRVGDDVYRLCSHVIEIESNKRKNQQPQQQRDQRMQQQDDHSDAPPSDIKQAFIAAMRDSNFIRDANDQSVPTPMLAALARCYIIGRVDEMRRIEGGWKSAEKVERDYGFILDPNWMPDSSWRWWTVVPKAAFRMPGPVGNAFAEHMNTVPQWR